MNTDRTDLAKILHRTGCDLDTCDHNPTATDLRRADAVLGSEWLYERDGRNRLVGALMVVAEEESA